MPSPENAPAANTEGDVTTDLTSCEREPIHLLGSIQSFGCLLAISDDWRIIRASENLEDFIGRTPDQVMGQTVVSVFDENTVHDMRTQAQLLSTPDSINRIFHHDIAPGMPRVDMSLHRSGAHFIVELEKSGGSQQDVDFARIQGLVSRLKGKTDVEDWANEAARCLRALTGFDRVMVYRFNHDQSGDVIAEAKAPQQTPYLGLRYPASDIPAQARKLYLRSTLRIIADVDAPTVPITPVSGADGEPIDLSLSVSRAVSPVHLDYMRNMGVAASMSVSIIRDGKLWGLLACHSDSPHYVNFRTRTAVELFAQLATYELAELEMKAMQGQLLAAQNLHKRLMTVAADGKLINGFADLSEQISQVIAYDGIAIRLGDAYLAEGAAPNAAEFDQLSDFLNTAGGSEVFVTDALSGAYAHADTLRDRVAGIMAFPISRTQRDYIVLFRREIVQTVHWAGNPEKPVTTTGARRELSPRKSFALWKEIVKGRSSPWTEGELRAAESIRITLLEVVLKIADAAAIERQRAAERQEIVVAELNHRVRNILSLIRSLMQQSQGDNNDDAFGRLSSRIQSFARAHDQLTSETGGDASFKSLLDIELDAFTSDRPDRLIFDGPDVLLEPDAFTSLALVIHELTTNSAKYGALSCPEGAVRVTTRLAEDGAYSINWCEIDGPPAALPDRRGFGTTIIERTIPYQMRGEARLRYETTGLVADFEVPARHIAEAPYLSEVRQVSGDAQIGRVHGTILVVEDNMIISLNTAEALRELGADHVETAGSVAGALAKIEQTRFDAVLLDVNLGLETSSDIARTLSDRGVPFCLVTGYSNTDDIIKSFPDAPVVRKPFSETTLAEAISSLLSTS